MDVDTAFCGSGVIEVDSAKFVVVFMDECGAPGHLDDVPDH
jgi:hypothetical protein